MQIRALPALRQELTLHDGPTQADGSPCWMLHDPAANRFYQLGWASFELLSRWPLGDVDAVLASVNSETTLHVAEEDLEQLLRFLQMHQLLQAPSVAECNWLWRIHQANRPGKAMWLLKNYLFFRIPLIRPEAALNRILPWLGVLYRPVFWWVVAGMAALGLSLVSRRWDEFTHTFSAYGGWGAAAGIAVSLSLAKILHEMGHALTARHFGCRVPAMGMAFLVMVPVLYTDTNDAWKLPSRRQRLLIGASGMLAELTLAAGATLAWCFLPEGPLRAGAFMLATTTWLATLAINSSPFMRFDGYFLLADWLGVPNLHARAFALARWRMRSLILGLDDPVPEYFPEARRRGLILFAWATWLYRLVLFTSIALLVYHMFFKALGLMLLMVELGWFIVRPIVAELQVWRRRRGELQWRRETRRSATLAVLLVLALLLPWQSRVSSPAVLGAAQWQGLYAPAAAEVRQVMVKEGDSVRQGQELARLASPELELALAQAGVIESHLAWQVAQQSFNAELQQQGTALAEEWRAARDQVESLQKQKQRLTLTAPFAGRVADVSDALRQGTALADGEHLLDVVGREGVKGEAFVDEDALDGLHPGAQARFVADSGEASVGCRLGPIDRLNLATLDQPLMASLYGGPIPVEQREHGLVPLAAVFRVRLEDCGHRAAPLREMLGVARLSGERYSLLQRGWRHVAAILEREAGL
ncbi:HlyD family efflux transporter periplasmic adaptor subunit [Chromobacterium sp. IIBBL 290-4]|uniref:HlyD family efflux transporter periplasmic adaptor subunit n=1 Tax=Chromobacterium sp. IIBBL 290-4 TaxID=2953890 RepID=UPI0020B8C030|nr:HlyD family efflux transporter periplasmic adaptor subunit [Chromobacterium sp. IIBBL 290-4]UTH76152.1 HlyD family efflux transporter periplasmic adaptor subunit [Chromobacterium sp. IIBBL 290-4]